MSSSNRVWLHKIITKNDYLNKKQDRYHHPSEEFIKTNIGIRRKMYCYCGSRIIRIGGKKMSMICNTTHQNIIYCGLDIQLL
ncbi:hypothetical protein [Megavirus chiliensis]|uniref:Uncharacterized protein n=2 Tax=Megavirus chilense TaxID=3060301 RepID=L7XZA0_9VIRU|nr:hypothetical protein MegaChil _gp0795 [Megavirus chiliensis]AEQ32513.1 hypothetical protein [Megavirus chiliensis]AGD92745.1 hypothetical protein LBA_00827 [Megavirus lba]